MSKVVDLTNHKFGRLTVIERKENTKHGASTWLCKCNCGQKTIVRASHLKCGVTQSCGCLNHEKTAKKLIEISTTHGKSRTNEYRIWSGMIHRCSNPSCKSYPDYGGRNIKVCARWAASFESFYLDMGQRPSKDYSLDRMNNDLGYSPDNCRWATRKEQANNTRRNKTTNKMQGIPA